MALGVECSTMTPTPEEPETIIILAPDQTSLYEHLRQAQEAPGRTRVILDRRRGDGRGAGAHPPLERRAPTPEAARALMSVLGFMVLHRRGDRWAP